MTEHNNIGEYSGYEAWKQWPKESFGKFGDLDATYFYAELARCGFLSCRDLRFFELGFGNGAFAGYVTANGGGYIGSELNEVLAKRAVQCGISVAERGIGQVLELEGQESFDAVVAFDVLEHLHVSEIQSFLLDANALLKPGGVVLARVPSGDSPFGRAVFHGDLTHLTALGSSAVAQLASKTGFLVEDIGAPRLPVGGVGLVRGLRRVLLRSAQTVVARLINALFHEGQPRVITPNLVFILRKPQSFEASLCAD